MASSEEAVGGGAETEVDTQAGGTTGGNADMGMGGGEVGLGVSGAQTGSTSGSMSSGGDSGAATDFPKAEPLAAKTEGADPGAKTDFLPDPSDDYGTGEDQS